MKNLKRNACTIFNFHYSNARLAKHEAIFKSAGIAQSVEQLVYTQLVGGSSPSPSTIFVTCLFLCGLQVFRI
jgi:hypothetical protein